MKINTHLMIALLAVGILSYGISASYAQNNPCDDDYVMQNNECVPAFDDTRNSKNLQIDTDSTIYVDGNTVRVNGTVNISGDFVNAVTLIVKNPSGGIAGVAQIIPNSDGSFKHSFLASGPIWKSDGTYSIMAKYGSDSSSADFSFGGSKERPPITPPEPIEDKDPPPPPPPPKDDADDIIEPEPVEVVPPQPECGPGTEADADGICQIIKEDPPKETPTDDRNNSCLIATAAYGTELAPQVQLLREIRDNTLYSTESGSSFMGTFNQVYYSFSPAVADLERQSPIFKAAVQAVITPMISTLGIMTLADQGSEAQVLGYGISVIALNLGMYIAAPIGAVFTVRKYFKSRQL